MPDAEQGRGSLQEVHRSPAGDGALGRQDPRPCVRASLRGREVRRTARGQVRLRA